MAEPRLFRTSGIAVSPQLAGERSIKADPKTGEMFFADPVAGQLRLAEMRGLRRIPGTVTAGPGGDFASVSAAVAAAVAASDPARGIPASVVLMPGTTGEGLAVPAGSWVQVTGLGRARIAATGGEPALAALGGTDPTRVELKNLELYCGGAASAIKVDGGVGGVVLEAEACKVESSDNRLPTIEVSGLAEVSLRGCVAKSSRGTTALRALGQVDMEVVSCDIGGGATVSSTGKWLLDRSRVVGHCYVESKSAAPARLWGSRLEGSLGLGGPGEVVGCDVGRLVLDDGAGVEASLSKLRLLDPNPNAFLNVDRAAGILGFVAADTARVDFPVPRIDANYHVTFALLDRPAGDEVPWLGKQDKEGFEVQFLSPQTLMVSWVVSTL